MYDFWEIFVPFSKAFCTLQRVGSGAADIVGVVDFAECGRRGLMLGSRRVMFSIDAEGVCHDLYHPWESIPSSFTDIAVKVHQSHLKRSWPGITLKASPAKLLQGHNVYGSTSAATGALELLAAFCRALPQVSDMLDWGNAQVKRVDVTYSVQLPDAETMANCLTAIGSISHRHLRASKEADYESTIYFNKRTSQLPDAGRSVVRVVYAKLNEMEFQLENLRRLKSRERTSRYDRVIAQLESDELRAFAANRLRFEGRGLKRWFEQKGIPQNLWQLLAYISDFEAREGVSFCEWAWRDMFADMFAALGDSKVKLTQDSKIHKELRKAYGVERVRNGKPVVSYTRADRLMMFYRSLASEGWEKTKRLLASSTFYDSVNALLAIGVTKAQLQNARHRACAKLLHLIKIDFDAQTPAGYVEPCGTVLEQSGGFTTLSAGLLGGDFVRSVGKSRDQLIAEAVSKEIGGSHEHCISYVAHLKAGRPIRVSDGEQLHLAVFADGSFELVRGDVSAISSSLDLSLPVSAPDYDPDDPDLLDYLGDRTPTPLEFAELNPSLPREYVEYTRRTAMAEQDRLDRLRRQLQWYEQNRKPSSVVREVVEAIQLSKSVLNQLWHRHYEAKRRFECSTSRPINQESVCQI